MHTVLEVKNLCKTYVVNKIQNNVLRNINFTVNEGELIAIMGPSGSGKSTLLYTISGMEPFNAGEVIFNQKPISTLSSKALSQLRLEEMGFVFQQMHMLKNLCILDNIILPAYEAKLTSRSAIIQEAETLMRQLDIVEVAANDITEVSGGQLQRACICRALINHPKVIFADEPTGSLNSKTSEQVMEQFIAINRQQTTILMVTHNVKVAAMCDKVIYLVDGNIQGEIILGKYQDEQTLKNREQTLSIWLMERGW